MNILEREMDEALGGDRITPPPPTETGKSWTPRDEEVYLGVPPNIRGGLVRYVDNGLATGSFLTAVLTNNLLKTFTTADRTSLEAIDTIIMFVANTVPHVCRGTKNDFTCWIMMSDRERKRQLFGARNWTIFKEWHDEQESK